MRAVIGQFYGPYSTVRPAKFESSPVLFIKISYNENFESYFENICIRTKHFEKQKQKEQGLTKFKLHFSDLLETESVPDPKHHTSQKLDNFLSAER